MEKKGEIVVRRRADGIPQIVRARAKRSLSVEPYVGSLALAFIAVALYVGTLGAAAVVVLLAAACAAVDAYRRHHPAGPERRGAADVVRLPLTASRR